MEAWTSVTDCLCILCHFAAKKLIGIAVWIVDGIKAAGTDAAAAALTFIIIDNSFFLRICNCVTSAFLGTAFTATAQLFIDDWLTAGVLSHFSCTASAAHSDVLNCAAKTGCLMSLEMGKTDFV